MFDVIRSFEALPRAKLIRGFPRLDWSDVRTCSDCDHGEIVVVLNESLRVAARYVWDEDAIELRDEDATRAENDPVRIYVENCTGLARYARERLQHRRDWP